MVGLEFDNPVGTGTGKYNDHQLFEAELNHASLVPIIGLLKAEDFVDQHPSKPLRVKRAEPSPTPSTKPARVENGVRSGSAGTRPSSGGGALQVNLPVNPLYEMVFDKGGSGEQAASSPPELEVGSLVEVTINQAPGYGVIRWIGYTGGRTMAGIEMEEEYPCCTDGFYNGRRYFTCPPHKAYFVRLSQCRQDARFQDPSQPSLPSSTSSSTAAASSSLRTTNSLPGGDQGEFGSIECPTVEGEAPPLTSLEPLYGKNKGIQGHHNSCYLDATLFALFSCTSVLDSILFRPPGSTDIPQYLQVQRVLREEIINPLRTNFYVRADRVMKLRTLLDKLSSVSGLTSEEKDPEEFLNCLLNQIMKAEPFLKLSSGQESFFYQLFPEKDERLTLPTVQNLFDQSFLNSNIKLQEVPACLLIQMPRFGRQFKMYPRILPSQYLDITDILNNCEETVYLLAAP